MGRLISNFFINWLSKERPPSKYPICDFERIRYEVRPCDVLLIEGRSRVSDVIKLITQSSWSHACLYIGRLHDIEDPTVREIAKKYSDYEPDTQLVLEGVLGKGTIISPLHEYKHDHIRICRPRGLSPTDAQKAIGYAIHQLGTNYDVRQIFDLARLLFPWTILPRRYRSKLFEHNAGTSTHTVCSTIIAEAFAEIEFPILPFMQKHNTKGIELIRRNPRLYTPRDFDYSPYFEIIKYPFLDFATHSSYRALPWNREGLVSHDDAGIKKELKKQPLKPDENKLDPSSEATPTTSLQTNGNTIQPDNLSDSELSDVTQEKAIPVHEELATILENQTEDTLSPTSEKAPTTNHTDNFEATTKSHKTPSSQKSKKSFSLARLKFKSKKKQKIRNL